MLRTLVKTTTLTVLDQPYTVSYFKSVAGRGIYRYSAEIVLSEHDFDTVILDDDSIEGVEARVATLVPSLIHIRNLGRP